MDSFFGELIKLGAAGLVIWVIAAPLIKYMIDRSKDQDKYIQNLISEHLATDWQKHQKIISSFEKMERRIADIPSITVAEIGRTYPMEKFNRATDHILAGGPKTVVNVLPGQSPAPSKP